MFTVIIPARFASSRLPAKPLADINGTPMVLRVVKQALKSAAARVVVATDDQRIADVITSAGVEVVMTDIEHESGTDRLQQAAQLLGLKPDDIVVNVQGDEPFIPPENINQLARNMADNACDMATLSWPFDNYDSYLDPNAVKLVTDQQGRALYFSRAPIPFNRDFKQLPMALLAQRHIGIYAYRVSFLNQFIAWPQSPLETTEKLEQLRALDNGCFIHVEPAIIEPPAGVDTEHDLAQAILTAKALDH